MATDRINRWGEFFQVNGEYSMRNLSAFIGVILGGFVVIYMAIDSTLTWDIFGIFMAASGGVYGLGKWQDEKTARSTIYASAEPDINTTTINQAESVNTGPTDKVTVTPKRKAKK